MMGYRFVITTRAAFMSLQIAVLVAFASIYWIRSGSAPTAAGGLAARHVLTVADLKFDAKPLLGKQLKAAVEAGEKITPGMVEVVPAPLAPAAPGTLAAIVVVDEGIAVERSLDVGAWVLIQRRALPDVPGRILSRSCERKRCTICVMLEALPAKEVIDMQAFAAAELVARPVPAAATAASQATLTR